MFKRTSALIVLCGVALASCLPTQEGFEYDLSGQDVRITFLHTSDIHSRLIPYDFNPLKTDVDLGLIPEAGPFGGATRMAALLKRERARADRSLHVDSGDCFQGAPIFNVNEGEVEFRFLSEAGLDAAVVGNHEFDAGALNFAEQARDHARFSLLAANYEWMDPNGLSSHHAGQYTSPYSIHHVQGLKVGVIGMANLSSLNSIVEGGNSLQVTPFEQNEAARRYVEFLKPLVDLVVVVTHLGLHEDQELIRGYEAFYEYGTAKEHLRWQKDGITLECDRTLPADAQQGCAGKPDTAWEIREWFGTSDRTHEGVDRSVVRVFIPGVSGIDIIFGGHLHVVLNPPQTLLDPSGRNVLLVHSGAFAKYVGRLDAVVRMPEAGADAPEGAELVSHDYRALPLDALWCDDDLRAWRHNDFWDENTFQHEPLVKEGIARCSELEDRRTTELLQPYILGMDTELQLTSIFGYSPQAIVRRSNSTDGDSPLGNLTADSMRKRRRVEAEMALTNTLGIRDNLYPGPITQEAMFNVFPFENTINIMYLSGSEMQQMLDFVAARSAERGCQAQAQISGASFTMDCAQAQLNALRLPCDATLQGEANGTDCPQEDRENHSRWQCLQDGSSDPSAGRCYANTATEVRINRQPLDRFGVYKIAVNDYIAKGGSGFAVLKRNTTRIETGISLRDSLIGYLKGFCSCEDINNGYTHARNDPNGEPCGMLVNPGVSNERVVDDQTRAFCAATGAYADRLAQTVGSCTCADILQNNAEACGDALTDDNRAMCRGDGGPTIGRCSCAEALAGDPSCGYVPRTMRAYCLSPTTTAVISGLSDGRIGRRVK
ncbi:MAG TPA: bifunctional UDP-sugar hydrolase/5'-nucleotidase [Myxococcaceae bacterium]|nr:bifunctional UDP-sugar hydrolase/5'-nucleotidase [Myxococcaceae bacterium]